MFHVEHFLEQALQQGTLPPSNSNFALCVPKPQPFSRVTLCNRQPELSARSVVRSFGNIRRIVARVDPHSGIAFPWPKEVDRLRVRPYQSIWRHEVGWCEW